MRVVVTTESRLMRTPDARVWIQAGPGYGAWARYLSGFDTVRLVARVLDVPAIPAGSLRVDGDGIEVWPVPYYVGPRQYLLRRPAIRRALRTAAGYADAVLLRVPSPIGSLLADIRERHHLPYALEVIGDPYDVLAPRAVRHPVRPLLRHWSAHRLRHQCQTATAVAYVTDRSLQARYPAAQGVTSAGISTVDLPSTAYAPRPRSIEDAVQPTTLISVGSLAQMTKGIDTLIEALARLAAAGKALRLVHVGDGRYRGKLERLAARLSVADRVVFTGDLPSGDAVRRLLDAADLFVLPSRTEGLPRALVEAMARGLPAISSTVGGIPELLAAEDLVTPDDPAGLASAISRLLADPTRMAAASARNLTRSRDFSAESLTPRRTAFYQSVADAAGAGGRPFRARSQAAVQ